MEDNGEYQQEQNDDQGDSGEKKQKADGQTVCKFWNQGSCRFGKTCRSFHDPDVPQKPKKENCKFYSLGKCKFGDKCKSFHPRGALNAAAFGAIRAFSPGVVIPSVLPTVPFVPFAASPFQVGVRTAPRRPRDKNATCPFFAKGECKFGSKCQKSHGDKPARAPKDPSAACEFFAQGTCKFGSLCRQRHTGAGGARQGPLTVRLRGTGDKSLGFGGGFNAFGSGGFGGGSFGAQQPASYFPQDTYNGYDSMNGGFGESQFSVPSPFPPQYGGYPTF